MKLIILLTNKTFNMILLLFVLTKKMEKGYKKQKINFYYFLCILDIIKKKQKKIYF